MLTEFELMVNILFVSSFVLCITSLGDGVGGSTGGIITLVFQSIHFEDVFIFILLPV